MTEEKEDKEEDDQIANETKIVVAEDPYPQNLSQKKIEKNMEELQINEKIIDANEENKIHPSSKQPEKIGEEEIESN